MRYSRAFIPTLKEAPKDATTASHALLLRAGYVRQVGAGLYEFLPLGQRVLRNIERVVRTEMDAAGAQEVVRGPRAHMRCQTAIDYWQPNRIGTLPQCCRERTAGIGRIGGAATRSCTRPSSLQ